MELLVSKPIAAVRAGNWDDAVAKLDAARSTLPADRRSAALVRADLDESYGVLVFLEGTLRYSPQLETAALPFLERAIGSYRQAYGDQDLEVATALQSWADALVVVDRVNNDARARAGYCEAFHIRFAALGPTDPSTGAALAGVLRLAPAGTSDAETMRQISPLPLARAVGTLQSLLIELRSQFASDQAGRALAYKMLATEPRYVALCPADRGSVVQRP